MKKIVTILILALIGFGVFAEEYKIDQYGYFRTQSCIDYLKHFEEFCHNATDEQLIERVQQINEVRIYMDYYNSKKDYEKAEEVLRDKFHMYEKDFKKMITIISDEVELRVALGENNENAISFLYKKNSQDYINKQEQEVRVQNVINNTANLLKNIGNDMQRIGNLYN